MEKHIRNENCKHEEEHIHDENRQCGCNHSADGTENEEHILDMAEQGEMLFQNIKDNTDSVFNLIKTFEELNNDEDLLDVIRINASEILDIEKKSTSIYEEFKKVKFLLINCEEKLNQEKLNIFEDYFNVLNKYEKESTEIFEKLIIKLK